MDIIRLFIIEDHPISLKHQQSIFGTNNDIFICGTAPSIDDASKAITTLPSPPHVILCNKTTKTFSTADVSWRKKKRLEALFPQAEIVVPTAFEDEKMVLRTILGSKKGASRLAKLTLRERECLQIIAKGLSNQETASVLQISRSTIRTHLEHIFQKLDVNNRVEAITEGIRQGIIEL